MFVKDVFGIVSHTSKILLVIRKAVKMVSPDWDELAEKYMDDEVKLQTAEKPKKAFQLLASKKKSDVFHNIVRDKTVKDIQARKEAITRANRDRQKKGQKLTTVPKVNADRQSMVKNYQKMLPAAKKTALKQIREVIIPSKKNYSYRARTTKKVNIPLVRITFTIGRRKLNFDLGGTTKKVSKTVTRRVASQHVDFDEKAFQLFDKRTEGKKRRFIPLPKDWRPE